MQMKPDVELQNVSNFNIPLEELKGDRAEDAKRKFIGQIKVPVYQKPHFWSPDFVKCDGKIIKYNLRALGIWRALFSCSHTILTDWETWQHMGFLFLAGFITTLIVIFTGSSKTLGEASPVTSIISLLISFILSAYIAITVNRWDRIRNGTLGALWGALENLNMIVQRILLANTMNQTSLEQESLHNGTELALSEDLIRLSRLTMILTFKAVQDLGNADQLLSLLNQELINEEERQWLLAATPGTRPLVVVTWMEGYVGALEQRGYTIPRHLAGLAGMQLNNIRGGIGATLGAIGAQLPYPYVHIVYWTVQLLLAITAVQYGCDIGVNWYAKQNGNSQYSPDTGVWPEHQTQWWTGQVFVDIAAFMIFALFSEGIMNICAKLSNPMNLSDIAFSERVYASFLYNNCKALRAGKYSYDHLGHPALLGPTRQGSGTKAAADHCGASFGVWGDMGPSSAGRSGAETVAATEFSVVGTHGQHSEGAILNLAVGLSG